ncbi:protein phosphatase PPM6, putative [Plasmodium relictum]|uniref:Protein phosphatase PPM6, putative n=1 Tax=Plasmodium relictum TaxID=85471 RepID=A0A1J1HEP1_PLARL|nr:protein phosphatase PPM6, putative [Plasmodium relictum]CRH02340.1 protein phosphatase PPM6, putative [Plasmodium relictum]
MGNCISFINYSKFKLKNKKLLPLDLYSNNEIEKSVISYASCIKEEETKEINSITHKKKKLNIEDKLNEEDNKKKKKNIENNENGEDDEYHEYNEIDEYNENEDEKYITYEEDNKGEKQQIKGKKKKKEKKKERMKKKMKEKGKIETNISNNCKLNSYYEEEKKNSNSNYLYDDESNDYYNQKLDMSSDVNSFYKSSVNGDILFKKNKHENLLNIKYSSMILNDIRDVDIIVVFLFSLFLYFNANNIVDMLDKNKKERYFLINSLNVSHDIIKFPTFPKEIVDSFLKNDFTLLKKYIKNKCNKLKKKYRTTYFKKKNSFKDEKNQKKIFKYELKKKKEKCSFSKIVESIDRNDWLHRDITQINCDNNLPDLEINFIVMGAYRFYQRDMKPFQDKNTFFYKSPSYTCDAEISVACKKGKKLDFPNQDDFTIIQTNEWILIMVFDGHGPSGHDISNFVHVVLPLLFSYNIEQIFENPVRTMKTLFYMINCYLVNYSYCINNNINPININFIDYNLSGTTCTIILYNFLTKKIYSAHTGDSRAVMGKQSLQTNKFRAYNITEDHKPSLKLEKDRIVAFGGEVKKLQGDVSYRVFVKDEMYPGLAMSRAIGDITSSFIGVTCEPTIKILDKSDEDKFIIVATDGIWEFISSEECVQMVSKKRKKKVHIAMEEIIKESWKRWAKIDTVDDMTLVILYF